MHRGLVVAGLVLVLSLFSLEAAGTVYPWESSVPTAAPTTIKAGILPRVASTIAPSCVLNTTYPNYLPWTVLPRNYQLNISAPNPNSADATKYNGSVTITLQIIKPTSCIVLHSSLITFQSVNLKVGSNNLTPINISFAEQFAIFQFASVLNLASAVLTISYVGQVNTQGAGFFISDNTFSPSSPEYPQTDKERADVIRSYPNHPQRKTPQLQQGVRKMFATQMEPTSARRAFPCFDEPDLKAHWQAKITIPANQGLTALFNTRETKIYTSTENGVAVQNFEFEQTMQVMSSYLVAMAIGEFDYVERNDGGVRFRVYTPPGASQYGLFALNATVGIVKYFSDIWKLPFSQMHSKMDQISVPNVVENAMENWGLLTYWPPFLLVDSQKSTRVARELVSIVTVHEISHQWFGDTITCPTWQSEYLQEGFARLFQYIGTNYLFPEWDVFLKPAPGTAFGDISFYGWPYDAGMAGDFKGVAPAVIVPIEQQPLSTMFYEKGASVNRMLYLYLGEQRWNQALSYHLNKHKWTNPNVYDLARSFDTLGNFSFQSTILPWLLQPNFPVVTLSVDANNMLTVTQKPMSRYASPGKQLRWWIPLTIKGTATPRSFTQQLYITKERETFHLPALPRGATKWSLEGDPEHKSFIVSSYADNDQWEYILNSAASPSLNSVYRREQVQGIFMLSTMGHEPLSLAVTLSADRLSGLLLTWVQSGNAESQSSALDLLQVLATQWQAIASPLLPQTAFKPVGDRLRANLFGKLLRQVGWDSNGDSTLDGIRGLSAYWSVYLNDPSAFGQALRIFDSKKLNTPADIKQAVFFAAAASNNKARYAILLQAYTDSKTSASDKALLQAALTAGPSDTNLCQQSLNATDQQLKDYPSKLGAAKTMLTMNSAEPCRAIAWMYYQSTAQDYWKQGGFSVTETILGGIDAGFATQAGKTSVDLFLHRNEQVGHITPTQRLKVLTLVQINIDLSTNNNN